MLVSKSGNAVLFQTPFDDKFDLVQRFRNVDNSMRSYNGPIDFMDSGLIRKEQRDVWHMDVFFASNTDEATPCHINGSYIGANHRFDFANITSIYMTGRSFVGIACKKYVHMPNVPLLFTY